MQGCGWGMMCVLGAVVLAAYLMDHGHMFIALLLLILGIPTLVMFELWLQRTQ